MHRYPAFDPPEYVSWEPDPELVKAFRDTVRRDPIRRKLVATLDRGDLLAIYRRLLRARLHDIGLKRWVRQGVISKAWLGTGEEATTVGPVYALNPERDYVAPMIRNASACCDMGMPLSDMFRGYLATSNSPSRGRDIHIGAFNEHVIAPVSPIGVMVPVTMGVALGTRMRGTPAVTLTWVGDGTSKSGPAHEGFNFAAVQRVPVIYILQNNQVALGTRVEQAHLPGSFEDLPGAYGMAGWGFDGNNVLDAWAATRLAVDRCLAGDGPVMLIAETFRMGGHATHDEREARDTFPAELFETWGRRDPIGLFEEYLKTEGVTLEELEGIEHEVEAEVDRAAEEALQDREKLPEGSSATEGVYATG
ncbi:MAG: thiamine pyrophosphate-dependent dehydrogenase E1 component subunit alpha [Gemmatimonadales bacterium]